MPPLSLLADDFLISISLRRQAIRTSLYKFTPSHLPSQLHLCPYAHQAVQAEPIPSSMHADCSVELPPGPPGTGSIDGGRHLLKALLCSPLPPSWSALWGHFFHKNLEPINSFNCFMFLSSKVLETVNLYYFQFFLSSFPTLLQSGVCATFPLELLL